MSKTEIIFVKSNHDLRNMLKSIRKEIDEKELEKILERDCEKIMTITTHDNYKIVVIREKRKTDKKSAKELGANLQINAYTYPQNNKKIQLILEDLKSNNKKDKTYKSSLFYIIVYTQI